MSALAADDLTRWLFALMLGFAAQLAFAQATVRELRAVAGFDRVVLHGVGELIVTQGDRERLEVEAEPKYVGAMRARVHDGVLVLDLAGNVKTQAPLRYHLTVRNLRELAVDGSGDIRLDRFAGQALKLVAAGSGDVHARGLGVARLTVAVEGSGTVELAGEASDLALESKGSGSCGAKGLSVRAARVRLAGSGDAEVRVRDELDAELSGSGDLRLHGAPKVRQRGEGMGEIVRSRD